MANIKVMKPKYSMCVIDFLNMNTCNYTGFIYYNLFGGKFDPDPP